MGVLSRSHIDGGLSAVSQGPPFRSFGDGSAFLRTRTCNTIVAVFIILAVAFNTHSLGAREPVVGRNGMVVSVCPRASAFGADILKCGGNSVDAAVAVAFALAVTFPEAGNVGGGGFMLVHPGGGREPVVVDYREVAPATATRELFATLDSRLGHKAAGVPGTVRGLALAHQRFGRLPWKAVVAPAVQLARNGFTMDASLAASLNRIVSRSPSFHEFCRVYGKDGGRKVWRKGDLLLQTDLARTLQMIADGGGDAFYGGRIAELIEAEMQKAGGLIAKEDLASYRAKFRTPSHTVFRGHDIYCPPAPTGGIVLVQMLNVLENFDLAAQGRWSARTNHLIIEAMRLAYFDRACYLADPDFVRVPERLTSKEYAAGLAAKIDPNHAGSSERLAQSRQIALTPESDHTTHFSIIDSEGMAVSNTYTLEQSYGSRVVVRGAGFILNNEMGDFGWKPGYTDRRGTIGTEPNLIDPGKRMLSSQTPTIVARDGSPVLLTGSPGGRTIINTVLQVVLNVVEFDMNLAGAVDAPRFHHQWFPDRVVFERQTATLHPALMPRLAEFGHKVAPPITHQGDAHSISVDRQTGEIHGVADLRRNGSAIGY